MTLAFPRAHFALAAALLLSASVAAQEQPSAYTPQQPPYGQPAYGAPAGATTAPPAVAAMAPVVNPGQPPAGQPGAGATMQAAAPPFILSQVEHQQVYQVLQMWEAESAKIKTFTAKFQRQEYDAVWGPGPDKAFVISNGSIYFAKPDKGTFKIDDISRWTKDDPKATDAGAPGQYLPQKNEVGEHWVCDGKAVYEYDHRNKQLVVTSIPEEMRGASIVDGPLPFLFGAEAAKLDERYWIRTLMSDETTIKLDVRPRRLGDAANYSRVDVLLDRKTMQPTALQVYLPGGQQRHVYVFETPTINGKLDWFSGLFSAPRTPLGWKKVKAQEPPPLEPGQSPQSAAAPGAAPR